MNILLFGGGLQVLAIARGLKEVGHNVDVLGEHNEISSKSRYVRNCIFIEIKSLTPKDLLQIVKSGCYSVIIPTEDDYASWLSYNKTEIEHYSSVKCAIADFDVYSLASDKSRLLKFCKEKNFPHPKTAVIDNNYDEISEYVGFPALVKPNHSAGARGIRLVNSNDELRAIAKQTIKEYGECSLQEFISGKDYYYNVMLYRTKKGEWGNHVITKIIRYYPIKGGSSSFCYTIENDKMLEICRKILDELQWVGFADFDVLEKGDSDYRVIEINPRIPASVKAATISGVNFGEMIVRDSLGMELPQYTYKPGAQLRYLGLDIAWFLASPNRFKAKPSWFKFFGKNLHYQDGGKHDIFAMITSIWMGVKKQLNPKFRKDKAGMN